jgi:hypothetical protein
MSTLPPYQQRVVDEKTELDDKLSRLKPFLLTEKFSSLPQAERDRMVRQAGAMEDYSTILGERIAAFTQ